MAAPELYSEKLEQPVFPNPVEKHVAETGGHLPWLNDPDRAARHVREWQKVTVRCDPRVRSI